MPSVAELTVLINGQDSGLRGTIDSAEKSLGGFGQTLGKVSTIAGGFLAANVVAGGVQQLTGFVNDSIAAVKESNLVNAQLEAVLASTGGAANVSAEGVRNMAAQLEKNTLFEDEAILKGANLLLTFTNIKESVDDGATTFSDATAILVDMAQAMGTDVSSQAIQLGKALNDPVAGISALTRVGVTFSEQQKEQIKNFMEAGQVAEAQGIILAELNKEFGGSAMAASNAAGASEAYKDRMNDLQETLGAKLLPIQEKVTQAKIAMITVIADRVIPILEELYAKHWPAVSAAIEKVVAFITTNWPKIQPVIAFAADFVIEKIGGMLQVVEGIITVVSGVIDLVTALVHGDWAAAWDALQQIASGVVDTLVGYIKFQFGNLPGIMLNLGKQAVQGFIDGLESMANKVAETAADIADAATFGLAGKLGIKSPSTVGIRLGEYFAEGFAIGMSSIGPRINEALSTVPTSPAQLSGGVAHLGSTGGGGGGMGSITVNVQGSILSEKDVTQIVRDSIMGGGFRGVISGVAA